MDSQTFINNIAKSHAKFSNEINKEYLDALEQKKNTIQNNISEFVRDVYPTYPQERILEIISNSFVKISEALKEASAKMSEKVEIATKNVVRLSSAVPVERANSILATLVHELLNDYSFNKIYEAIDGMNKEINLHMQEFIPSRPVSPIEMEDKLFRFRINLNTYLEREAKEISMSIKHQIDDTLNGYVYDVGKYIQEYVETNNIDVSALMTRREDIAMSGYNIEKENNKYYLVDTVNNKKYELMEKHSGYYTTSDGIITVDVGNNITITVNNNKLVISPSRVEVSSLNNSSVFEIINLNDEFVFYYNETMVKDRKQIGTLLQEKVHALWPGLYNFYMQYEEFKKVVNESEKENKKTSRLEIDDYGNVHINEENRGQFIYICNLLGYEVREQDGEVYLAKNGVEGKLIYNKAIGTDRSELFTIEGNEYIKMQPDYYIISEKTVVGPLVSYNDSRINMSCFFDTKLTNMKMFINDSLYSIKRNDRGEIIYGKKVDNVDCEIDEETEHEIEGVFNEYLPSLTSAFLRNHRISKKTSPALDLLDELEHDYAKKDEKEALPAILFDEDEEERRIEEQIADLERNPIVREYIELKQKQQEMQGKRETSYPKL